MQSASGLGKFSHTAAALTFEYDKNANWDTFVKDLQAVRCRSAHSVELAAHSQNQNQNPNPSTLTKLNNLQLLLA